MILVLIVLSSLGFRDRIFFFARHVPGGDRTGHFCLMGLLGLGAILCLVPRMRGSRVRSIAWVSGAVIVFLGLEEGSQHFLPTRQFDFADFGFGALGVLVAGAVCAWWWGRAKSGQGG